MAAINKKKVIYVINLYSDKAELKDWFNLRSFLNWKGMKYSELINVFYIFLK